MKELTVNRATKVLAVFAALLPFLAVPVAAASSVVLPSPATVLTLSPVAGYIQDTLQGAMCKSPNTCAPVEYLPFWTTEGSSAIDAAIQLVANAPEGQGGRIAVFGYSNGAQVVAQWLTAHGDDPAAPSPDRLSFVLIGNATRAYGGANVSAGETMPQTKYDVIDISREYDLASDIPNGPFNVLAGANALAGLFVLHDYRAVDIHDPSNSVWTVGHTTYVFVPTKNLPLLEPLRWIGLSALADQLNGPLKAIVEQGYDRSYLPPPTPPKPSTPTQSGDPTGPTDPVDPSNTADTTDRADPTPTSAAASAKSVPPVSTETRDHTSSEASVDPTPPKALPAPPSASAPPTDPTDSPTPVTTGPSPTKPSSSDDGTTGVIRPTTTGHADTASTGTAKTATKATTTPSTATSTSGSTTGDDTELGKATVRKPATDQRDRNPTAGDAPGKPSDTHANSADGSS